jgi:hypothetical protein
VYNGGTVYNGVTAYGGTAPAGAPSYAPAKPASSDPVVRRGVSVFFAIAIVTACRAILVYSGVSYLRTAGDAADSTGPIAILVANLVVSGIFLALGFWARSGSKAAFLIGMVLYGLDMVLMLVNPLGHVAGIIVHGLFLYNLWNGFRQLP